MPVGYNNPLAQKKKGTVCIGYFFKMENPFLKTIVKRKKQKK